MSYQGVLKDAAGVPVPDGNYQLTFRLYNVASGGAALWTETQTLAVAGGILNATLGSVTPLSLAFDAQYWLGISVSGGAELTPRVQLTSAPYALRAAVADADGLTLPYDGSAGSTGPLVKLTNTNTPSYSIAELGRTDRAVYGQSQGASGCFGVYGSFGGYSNYGYLGGQFYGAYGSNSTGTNYGYLGGASNAVYGHSTSGTAGYFDGSVYATAKTTTNTFRVMDGAAAGKVLTSDASGNATWQTISGATDSDWTISGSDMYSAVSGNVGIGVTNPNRKLYVAQDVNGLAFQLKLDNTNTTINSAAAGVLFSAGGSGVDRGKGALVYRCEGTWNRGSFHFLQEPNGNADNPTMSNSVMTIRSDGNVGVGTTTPGTRLDVNGTLKATGFQLTTSPIASYVLKSDASGVGTWQPDATLTLSYSGSVSSSGNAFAVTNTGTGAGIFAQGQDSGVTARNGLQTAVIGKLGTQLDGVQGYSDQGMAAGVYGEGAVWGVYGMGYEGVCGVADDASATGVVADGSVRGLAAFSDTPYPTGYAGYFGGDVEIAGDIHYTAAQSVIDNPIDPENRLLQHASVEAPELLLLYRGKVRLGQDGEATVAMPSYFAALTDESAATVSLTPVGRPTGTTPREFSYEWDPAGDRFRVYGEPGREVAWLVMAERDDASARQRPMVVEQEKGPGTACDKGLLLNPAAYGYPEERGAGYAEKAAHRQRVAERREAMSSR
jgi:hypothetical protein